LRLYAFALIFCIKNFAEYQLDHIKLKTFYHG